MSLDTVRADRLPLFGYATGATPAIDALARDGVVFERAYTTYPLTLPAHASLLSGLYPQRHGVRDNSGFRFDAAQTPCLPKLLSTKGYSSAAFVSAWILRSATGLGGCFELYDDRIDADARAGPQDGQRAGRATLERALGWLRLVGPRPFLLFLHLYEPHAPYTPPEPFAARFADPYDGEIAAADALVGELVAELRRLDRYDEALFVLLSDHGEGLGDHGELRHGVLLYEETVRVPLVVKLPGGALAGTRRSAPVSLVDVVPTVLAQLGVAERPSVDGLSLFAAPANRSLYAESWYPRLRLGWSELRLLVDERYAALDGVAPELYDLERDPRERHDLAGSERRLLGERLAALRALDRPPSAPTATGDDEARSLAALGYLAGGAARSGPLPDPKARVASLSRLEEALALSARGDDAGAVVAIEQLLVENPQMGEALPYLARTQERLGRNDEALATWRRVRVVSDDPSIALALAHLLASRGEVVEAASLAESALDSDPRRATAFLVTLAEKRGDVEAARRWTDRALAAGVAGEPLLARRARERARAGRPDEAVALLLPIAADAGPSTVALLAQALSDVGRAEEGWALLERAQRAAPEHPDLLESAGLVALRLERLSEARTALESAVRLAPARSTAWNSLGVARFRTGDPKAALAAWQRAAELDPGAVDALFNLAIVAAETGERALARDALRRYLARLSPEPSPERERAQKLLQEIGG